MKKILLLLIANIVFASVESEVEKERFTHKNHVLTDNFAQLQWQDTKSTKTLYRNWYGARKYCRELVLNHKKDWRLPNADELLELNKYKKYLYYISNDTSSTGGYWSNTKSKNSNSRLRINFGWYSDPFYDSPKRRFNVRCVRDISKNNKSLYERIKDNKNKRIKQKAKEKLKEAQRINTLKAYESFIEEFDSDIAKQQIDEAKQAIQDIYKKEFEKAKQQDTISSYVNFINKYIYAPQVDEAFDRIYQLNYAKAKKKNTIQAYLQLHRMYYDNRFDANQFLKILNISYRFAYKNGPIGKRYVPYTTTSYTTYDTEYITINGKSQSISKSRKDSYSNGGYNENIYGYKAIYEFKNNSDNYYIIQLKMSWKGSYSKYETGSYGAWSGKSGTYSELVTKTVPASYKYGFVIAPHGKEKFQFEVGETQPKNIQIFIFNVIKIDKKTYDELQETLNPKSDNVALMEKFLKDKRFKNWHNKIRQNELAVMYRLYAKKVKFKFVYNKNDYDPDFENEVKLIIKTPFKMKLTYHTDFGKKEQVIVDKKYVVNLKLKDISIDKLKAYVDSIDDVYGQVSITQKAREFYNKFYHK